MLCNMDKVGTNRLAGALIRSALMDLDQGKNSCEVLAFFNSSVFDEIAEVAGFDDREIASIRRKSVTGQYDRKLLYSKAPYRTKTPNLQGR